MIGGDDFKSGQTKMKSVMVDFLVSAGSAARPSATPPPALPLALPHPTPTARGALPLAHGGLLGPSAALRPRVRAALRHRGRAGPLRSHGNPPAPPRASSPLPGIKPTAIVSYNHLGNNDGKNLQAPQTFRSKEISKSNVVDDMVGSNRILYDEDEHPDHVVVIKYVPKVALLTNSLPN